MAGIGYRCCQLRRRPHRTGDGPRPVRARLALGFRTGGGPDLRGQGLPKVISENFREETRSAYGGGWVPPHTQRAIPGPEASQSPLYLMGRVALVVAAWRPTWSPNGPATPSRRGPTVRFSGRTYPKLAWLLRALCAVVGCCCLPLVAGVAVIVAVRLDHESRWPGVTRLCAWCQNPIPAKARRDAVCCSVRCRQARHRFLRAVGRADSVATGRPLRLAWSLRVAPPPIGLTAADLFAGGKVSRADSRVR